MNSACEACKGACCEGMILPLKPYDDEDANRWFALHGSQDVGEWLYVKCPCTKLSAFGTCSIYHDRPKVCSDFQVGGSRCRHAIKRNRSLIQADQILRLLPCSA